MSLGRWVRNLEARSSLIDWRKGHSGAKTTVTTAANIALVRNEMLAHTNNTSKTGGAQFEEKHTAHQVCIVLYIELYCTVHSNLINVMQCIVLYSTILDCTLYAFR